VLVVLASVAGGGGRGIGSVCGLCVERQGDWKWSGWQTSSSSSESRRDEEVLLDLQCSRTVILSLTGEIWPGLLGLDEIVSAAWNGLERVSFSLFLFSIWLVFFMPLFVVRFAFGLNGSFTEFLLDRR